MSDWLTPEERLLEKHAAAELARTERRDRILAQLRALKVRTARAATKRPTSCCWSSSTTPKISAAFLALKRWYA